MFYLFACIAENIGFSGLGVAVAVGASQVHALAVGLYPGAALAWPYFDRARLYRFKGVIHWPGLLGVQ